MLSLFLYVQGFRLFVRMMINVCDEAWAKRCTAADASYIFF